MAIKLILYMLILICRMITSNFFGYSCHGQNEFTLEDTSAELVLLQAPPSSRIIIIELKKI